MKRETRTRGGEGAGRVSTPTQWVLLGLLVAMAGAVPAVGQDVALFSVHAPAFADDANPFRYSPLGAVDDDPATVFAVPAGNLATLLPLFSVDFSRQATLDGIRIQAGYFDPKYFAKNSRIRTLGVTVRTANPQQEERQFRFDLRDAMEAQDLLFGEKLSAAGIDISVVQVYPGSTWQDVVVSSLQFLQGAKVLRAGFSHEPMNSSGSFVGSQEDVTTRYDGSQRPLEETLNYHKMGWETTWSNYDPEGRLVFQNHRVVDPETSTDTRLVYFYAGEALQPQRASVYGSDGSPDGEITFTYSGSRQTREVRTGSNPASKSWVYQNNLLVKKETTVRTMSGEDRTEVTEYFYRGTTPLGERITSKTGTRKSVCLYQYVVAGSQVKFMIPVLDSSEWAFEAKLLRYEGPLLVATISSMHSVY